MATQSQQRSNFGVHPDETSQKTVRAVREILGANDKLVSRKKKDLRDASEGWSLQMST